MMKGSSGNALSGLSVLDAMSENDKHSYGHYTCFTESQSSLPVIGKSSHSEETEHETRTNNGSSGIAISGKIVLGLQLETKKSCFVIIPRFSQSQSPFTDYVAHNEGENGFSKVQPTKTTAIRVSFKLATGSSFLNETIVENKNVFMSNFTGSLSHYLHSQMDGEK